jgi:hypothetical protein
MALYSPRYSRGYKNCATAEKKLKSLAIFYYGVEVGCPRNNQKNFSVPTKTNRNTICFGCFLVCFAIPKNNFFGLFRCFGSVSKQPKQTDLFRNKPKKTNTMSITGCGPAVLTRRRLCHSCWRNYCTVPIQFSCVVYCMTVWYSTSGSIRNKTLFSKNCNITIIFLFCCIDVDMFSVPFIYAIYLPFFAYLLGERWTIG